MLKKLKIYYIFVSLPFVMLLIGAAFFFDGILYTIETNPHPQINYIIFMIILGGGLIILLNAKRLMHEARTVVDFSRTIHAKTDRATLQEKANSYTGDLACITQMIATSGDRSISHQEQAALEHELANVRSRLNRRNALPQYLTGLLVGMGLLGTFIGLLATLNDISILITSFADLDMAAVNPIEVFSTMITRMKAPMQSMAIAFSASMFGLLGSIILGLMMVGLRRLQGDIFSLLSSEVARHIEIALSFESISLKGRIGEAAGGDFSSEILLRIEERLAESARVRQRALSAEIDDFKKQRGDMLRALTEQTEANHSFRSELQELGRQFGAVFNTMEKGNGEISTQISELTVHLAGDAKETHKLLGMQMDEQKRLINTLDSYKIEERLAEAARLQQRALSAEIDDFKNQRADMLRVLAEQTEASHGFRGELQQLGGRLGAVSNIIEQGGGEISTQISELTVHLAADAKQSHILLNKVDNNFRGELRKLGSQLGGQLDAVAGVTESGNEKLRNQIAEMSAQLDDSARQSLEQFDLAGKDLNGELQQLGSQLTGISDAADRGNDGLLNRLTELAAQLDNSARESLKKLDNAGVDLRHELQQLGSQLAEISTAAEKGNDELAKQIPELTVHLDDSARQSLKQLDNASKELSRELQVLGGQLDAISNLTEKGNDQICTRIYELTTHMAAEVGEPPQLPLSTDE
ncbi:MAG: hypothetical protein ABR605_02870 [Desulfurivibrionaceae bacterium]